MERPGEGEVVMVPSEINDAWLGDFTANYGAPAESQTGRFELTVDVEDWMVQPEAFDQDASYYLLDDRMGPDGWRQTITGTVHSASDTYNRNYPHNPNGPVVALLNARIRLADGSEEALAPSPERFILVRLDRTLSDLKLKPLEAAETVEA